MAANAHPTYSLLERLANLLRAEERREGAAYGLQPVHLDALAYLMRCNRYSDSPTAVGQYLGLTRGTVSQTLIVLEKKGYIESTADPDDRRKTHLSVTRKGKKVLETCVPPRAFREALGDIDVEAAAESLQHLLLGVQISNGGLSFGVCHSCAHFVEKGPRGQHQCGLTSEALSVGDAQLICREHEPTA